MEQPTAPNPDAFLEACPSRDLLRAVSGKWSPLVIVALEGEPARFGALRRQVQGITQKMLTQTLRQLQRSGLVERTSYDELPMRVDYRLTALGYSVLPPLKAMKSWAETNFRESGQAEAEFDRKYVCDGE